ncbi:MAG: glycosyltransferase 87 family protein [Acidobacteriaceae bacterium]|nr:glycosyltransferase 87 family protein [Acidobacteriaceae bacterium]
MSKLLHRTGYADWPFSSSRDRFSDFTIFQFKYLYWHKPEFFSRGFPINYPAPLADLFEFFFHCFPHHPTLAFELFDVLCAVVPCIFFARALHKRGIALLTSAGFSLTLLLFSWPALLLVDRGNMECVVWVATVIGFWSLATGRENTAAIAFGAAASFKFFPIILLGIFLAQKKWRPLFLGLLAFVVISIASLWILGPTIPQAWLGISYGLTSFKINYMACWRSYENGIDHSLFALIKGAMMILHLHARTGFLLPLAIYNASVVVGGIVLYCVRIRLMPLLNQSLLLMISCIYFTAFSGDGTLIHLYSLFAMLVFLALDANSRNLSIPGLNSTLLWLTFIVSPATYFIVHHGHRFEGQVKCLALGVLFLYALRYPLGPTLGSDERPDILSHPDASEICGASISPIQLTRR